jgi:hypothetical protein
MSGAEEGKTAGMPIIINQLTFTPVENLELFMAFT